MDTENFQALLVSYGTLLLVEEEPRRTTGWIWRCGGRGPGDLPHTVKFSWGRSDYLASAQTLSLGGILCAILRAWAWGLADLEANPESTPLQL